MKSKKTIVRKMGLMRPIRLMRLMKPMGLMSLMGLLLLWLLPLGAEAQIKIGGNVYGGGNQGHVSGNTKVVVMKGDSLNRVFGGARMANVGGKTFVNIDGKHATGNIVISDVYGGNDVAGTIGQSGEETTVPEELENVLGEGETKASKPKKNAIDNTWKTFVATSRSSKDNNATTVEDKWIVIGTLYGGSNGDFIYTNEDGDSLRDDAGNYIVQEIKTENGVSKPTTIAIKSTPFITPDIDKTYLEIKGGNIAHVYGGGNKATVRQNTTINIDNTSDDCLKYVLAYAAEHSITPDSVVKELKSMTKLSTFQSKIDNFAFNHARVFGGNNQAEMSIRPTWNLQQGIIRDLYSGGNKGSMTSPEGLLLEIAPDTVENVKDLVVENLYGGCRMADVKPTVGGIYKPTTNLPGYSFPPELSARVLIRGGKVNNVYGGNDITGTVYGGNAIGIYTTINGDVYGGGNGAYAYTDYEGFKNHDIYGDFWYSQGNYATSMEALNAHRPNAEQVSIRLKGESARKPTIIKGSVFIGGNCASMATKKATPMMELKIGNHVIADKVFLGNNGENMVDSTILKLYAKTVDNAGNISESGGYKYSTLKLNEKSVFANYMEAVSMNLQPSIVFDAIANGDPDNYQDYTSYVGSFYCGGNVGSMSIPGKNTYEITRGLNIFEKFVGGCNNADVPASQYNAAYEGGVLGSASEQSSYTDTYGKIKDRLQINLSKLTITPLRWNNDKTMLIWNTNNWDDQAGKFVQVENNAVNDDTRLIGGNVYGGCYNSGHVNGNVVININEDILKKDEVFGNATGPYGNPASGVSFLQQRDDVKAIALAVFGAGYGKSTEIWGSATVNLNKGYTFQIFGGGEQGIVGKKKYDVNGNAVKGEDGNYIYEYNPAYSSTVNLNGASPILSSEGTNDELAETEYIYGGGNEGNICGNTYVNLGNGRIYDAFGGASDADILGHTEVHIGRQLNGSGGYKDGFPWIKDIVYGGNDYGGTIYGKYENGYDFTSRVRNYASDRTLLHGSPTNENPGVLKSSTYVEYLQGRVDTIFGGNYGYYDYASETYDEDEDKAMMPYIESSFVNIRPKINDNNHLVGIFGGGTGYPKNREGDKSQDRSYVLIDIAKNGDKDVEKFKNVQIFGSGSYNGMGMRFDKAASFADSFNPDSLSSIVDLLRGKIKSVYGGSYNEGVTARTVINVPPTSTIHIDSIFGGAYGTHILPPCDVYESNINYDSNDATVTGAIYGGNNNERRTLYTKVNITAPVWSDKSKGYTSTVYGAGHGINTWSEYTEVNLLPKPEGVAGDYTGAMVYEVYGGGEMGHVLNAESVQKYMQLYQNGPSPQISTQDSFWKTLNDGNTLWDTDEEGNQVLNSDYADRWASDWKDAWTLGDYYEPNDDYSDYATNQWTNLTNTALVTHDADMDDRDFTGYSNEEKAKRQYKYNTNVRIHEGATVAGYAYGGGLGDKNAALSGDVYGTTYIGLLGGTVTKDIYAAGTTGAVYDLFGVGAYNADSNPTGFMASANAYIKGGSCRNVYGGGWKGDVGHHAGAINDSPSDDILGEAHVVIGDTDGTSFTNGIPTVQRNAYGGGEGGAVYGTAYLTMRNGYVGYEYVNNKYEEKLEDNTKATPNTLLKDAGCLFGGGYIDNSVVDKTQVKLYDGHVRGSLFGGGEIAAIGRGSISKTTANGKTTYSLEGLYRPGKTNIEMYGGQVHRNVFGGGRGSDNLGGHGSLNCDGYVFGQTEVHIHGGVVGTVSGVADGNGNVFGGGDEGYVYSAYENEDGTFGKGVKIGERYKDDHQGYYFKHTWADSGEGSGFVMDGTENIFTEDCKVLVEPHMKVKTAVTINGHSYTPGQYVPIEDLNTLQNKTADAAKWGCLDDTGIIIHNAVFAGGNTPSGSSASNANTASVFGNATASVNDIFHRDMITLGTRHTGGLYGDGNLTLVDGYRELNITNYGTDYYSIAKQIGIDAYHDLPEREADYYELRYKCLKACSDKDGTQYKPATTDANGFTTKASTITADEMQSLFVEEVTNPETGKKEKQSIKDGSTPILIYDATNGEWVPNTASGANYWVENGVLPVYAGRLMNSIQRADFCGVFGSRMVMQGAQDRVPEEVDFTNYTINRVREVSLNKKKFRESDPETTTDFHGNYFGIYNIVNYLGALTSDVDFGDESSGTVRVTENTDATTYKCAADDKAYGNATYYDWKKAFKGERKRNNGSSHNKVALASGVYLELTTEKSTGVGLYEKDWGPITGVVELDLINVSTGIGGGFVYAKNQHGVRSKTGHKNTTLTALNDNAVTQWDFTYDSSSAGSRRQTGSSGTEESSRLEFETSGNFVHSTQTIIDDCYNISNRYLGDVKEDGTGAMPAHYWYIKGSTYVYDQYISAYTGVPNAFSESVDIPLTISAASHGKMKLLNVQPNLYAYYSSPGVKLGDGKKVVINDKTYYKNDPISYWDWYLLSNSEKELFVDSTYVNCITCKIDGNIYEAGTYVMNKSEFASYKNSSHTYTDSINAPIFKADKTAADDDYIFRLSNGVSHDTGYILTYEMNNPGIWDNWFTLKNGDYKDKKTQTEYEAMDINTRGNYYDGPTYRLKSTYTSGMLLGQRLYKSGELIAKSIEDTYQDIKTNHASAIPSDPEPSAADYEQKRQAIFEEAYIVKNEFTITDGTTEHHYNVGATIPASLVGTHGSDVEAAYICTNSVQVTKDEVVYKDSRMSKTAADKYVSDVRDKMNTIKSGAGTMTMDQIKALATTGDGSVTTEQKKQLTELVTLRDNLTASLVPAYYCLTGGLYGGNYFESGKSYRGLEAWSSLTSADHGKFDYNYDALDLLIDPYYTNPKTGTYSEGQKYQYDGNYTTEEQVKDATDGNKAGYSVPQSVDYTASYNSNDNLNLGYGHNVSITRGNTVVSDSIIQKNDELTRAVYEESLANEQRHYAPVAVKNNGPYYVVNTAFQIGSTPYAVGETISSETYNSLHTDEQENVTELTFTGISSENAQTYYYCRDSYTVESGGTSVTNAANVTAKSGSTTCTITGTYNANDIVPLGLVIPSSTYGDLKNQQRNFTIHGISPTETSTLFVSRESNIYDLSKEKIITVIYQYDYDETDGQGNVTPISERHVVNIHLTFKSGVPIVSDITKPDIILPGDFTTLSEPMVTPGAYEVTGGGWELFESQRDAESHSNGINYEPNDDPLYWYQDGYYVAYYAKSYAGRTYSNYVPVSVANYHDLAEVMSDENKTHHMYIDNKNVKREPKIYINDYSESGKNGLDLFKNLYDLTLVNGSGGGYTLLADTIKSVSAPGNTALTNHVKLNERVRAGQGLEFFLRTDINHTDSWTSIGTDDVCFEGTLHGDGHTISGLNNSLFKNLCGEVYNLGVTGSFNTAGVVDKGSGYVESCWVRSSATTSVGGSKPYPVFGDTKGSSGYQVVNSYYSDKNAALYNTSDNARGTAYQMVDDAFYNGEVAYDLNNFYLYKRYSDKKVNSGPSYKYWKAGQAEPLTGYYASRPDLCSSGYTYHDENINEDVTLKYVEDRFSDGDFRYAAGVIPETEEERHWQEDVTDNKGNVTKEDRWSPIYPDDYIFFGQKLTYGWAPEAHDSVPTAVVRDGGLLSRNEDANRVYRAPAYYLSKAMNVAHFNPNAYLAAKSADGKKEAHPNMTAIDFAGHQEGQAATAYQPGWNETTKWFYQPLLDDDGLTGITNCDETMNLLVYAPAETAESGYANKATYDVLTDYFVDPVFDNYYDRKTSTPFPDTKMYDRVADATDQAIHGHLVLNNMKAFGDHLLVDKEDFNAPMAYSFDSDHRMWYQRKPADKEYVEPVWSGEPAVRSTKGWQGISIPFTAELVTTHQKGEITHFYQGHTTGHEYWLRELSDIKTVGAGETAKADFVYPSATGTDKNYTNTFLWDYYYENTLVHNQKDKNDDTYLEFTQKYYKEPHTHPTYPLLTGGKPYLLGTPGHTYYEFDLSGNFRAKNTAADHNSELEIAQLAKQVITFVSNKGIGIDVSDDEILRVQNANTKNGYAFVPTYSKKPIAASVNAYALSADGNSYDKVVRDTVVGAFRPYFTAVTNNSRPVSRSIVFAGDSADEPYEAYDDADDTHKPGTIHVSSALRKIKVTSGLKVTTTVRIVNASGITLNTFDLKPDETVETRVYNSGVYLVQTADGKFIRKIAVR